MRKIQLEEYNSEQSELDLAELEKLAFQLNRANVELMLEGKHIHQDALRVITAQILTVCETVSGISLLCRPLTIASKNAIPLSRKIYDASLFGSFVCTDPQKLGTQAKLYSIAHAHQNSTVFAKLSETFSVKVEAPYAVKQSAELRDAKKLFAKPNGGLRPCFEQDRAAQIDAISKISAQAEIAFSGVEAMIYKKASEITHGTYASFDIAGIEERAMGKLGYLESIVETCFVACMLSGLGLCEVLSQSFPESHGFKSLRSDLMETFKKRVPEVFA